MGARQDIACSGTRASLGSKSCRGASAGTLFCVGGMRAAGNCVEQGHMGEFGLAELPPGERRETVMRVCVCVCVCVCACVRVRVCVCVCV